ncbi:hypothetical protein F4774DRAFT_389638 [Daldinia eschscholtzii]|nr:hypothetical protein F4774DRAFT_389638 [Daldinia eschscholtzii]
MRVRRELKEKGPLKGIQSIYEKLDSMDRYEIVDFISPSKYFAWNLRPLKEAKPGSVEFRRSTGVDTAKKAKHWIAFTMAFV